MTERKARARRIVAYLKRKYPKPKSELLYDTPFQFVVAVILSAQCTDKLVNKVTRPLFAKYKTAKNFASLSGSDLQSQISSIPFFRNKAKHIIRTAKIISRKYKNETPRDPTLLQTLPGIGYKTSHVILGELFDLWKGIPTDTHVKRFAYRFDLSNHRDLFKISKDLENLIPERDWKYVNNGLVLYGRYICGARKHDCSSHPLTRLWKPAERRWIKAL